MSADGAPTAHVVPQRIPPKKCSSPHRRYANACGSRYRGSWRLYQVLTGLIIVCGHCVVIILYLCTIKIYLY
jgi:hypothetical protein